MDTVEELNGTYFYKGHLLRVGAIIIARHYSYRTPVIQYRQVAASPVVAETERGTSTR